MAGIKRLGCKARLTRRLEKLIIAEKGVFPGGLTPFFMGKSRV